jgi:hypothetical protein
MWQRLNSVDEIHLGDQLRYQTGDLKKDSQSDDPVFQVVKREQHYFEIIPKFFAEFNREHEEIVKRIIRNIDIGYYFRLELWRDEQ